LLKYRQLREIAMIQLKSLDEKDFIKTLKKASDDIYIKYTDNKKL
jgi:hypothetical protein